MGMQVQEGQTAQMAQGAPDVEGAVHGDAAPGAADHALADHGRAVVRDVFLGRLDAAGLVRGKRASVAEHEALRAALCDYLSYMSRDNLAALAEVVLTVQARAKSVEYPTEAAVRLHAETIQRRPFRENRIMRSWLGSVEGPVAEARGVLVELYRHLQRTGLPPGRGPYAEGQMAQAAQDNRRRVMVIEERIAGDCASAEDRQWLAAYLRDEQDARALVDAGRARRAMAGQEGGCDAA